MYTVYMNPTSDNIVQLNSIQNKSNQTDMDR